MMVMVRVRMRVRVRVRVSERVAVCCFVSEVSMIDRMSYFGIHL
jgi:hypothetical protein